MGKSILMIPPHQRDEAMIKVLRAMTNKIKVFVECQQNYGEYTCNQMLKYCYLE